MIESSKRVLLVNLPFYRLLGSHYNGVPLGLCYITAVLNDNGHACAIYNADYLDKKTYSSQIEMLNATEHYRAIHEDPDHSIWKEAADTILEYHPDFVGFSIYTANLPGAEIIASHLKRRQPGIRIVVGGAHASLAGSRILAESPSIDAVVRGEGEYAMLELANGKPVAEISGLDWRKDGVVISNEKREMIQDLDTLSLPDRASLYPAGRNDEAYALITSRGCPHNCFFCASPMIWDRRVRFRGTESVIQELQNLKSKGHRLVQFQDDCLTFGRKRFTELLDRMISEKLDLEWICESRLNTLTPDVVALMKEAGCIRVKVGVESGSPEILKRVNKGITTEQVIEKTRLIKAAGLEITAYFMIGFPGETNAQARQTIDLAKKISADYYSLSILAPYYGTRIYENFVAEAEGSQERQAHWEYFFHQNRDLLLTSGIEEAVIEEFLALNDYGKGSRV